MSTNEFISCGALNPNSLRGMDEAEKLYEQIRKGKQTIFMYQIIQVVL